MKQILSRLKYSRLKGWAVLFAMLVIQAPAGDWRNWTAGLSAAFGFEALQVDRLAQLQLAGGSR